MLIMLLSKEFHTLIKFELSKGAKQLLSVCNFMNLAKSSLKIQKVTTLLLANSTANSGLRENLLLMR